MQLDLVLSEVPPELRPGVDWQHRARSVVTEAGPADGVLEVVLTTDTQIHALNHRYRGVDASTDVLSFSYLTAHEGSRQELLAGTARARDFLGEPELEEPAVLVGQVLISVEHVRSRTERKHWSDEDELLFLMAHGLLHTLGYDHHDDAEAEDMATRERELLVAAGGVFITEGGEGP